MFLLEQDITKKKQVDQDVIQLDFDIGKNEKYKIEVIWDSTVYAKESELRHLPGFYYLIS